MDKTPTELTAESERAFHATSHPLQIIAICFTHLDDVLGIDLLKLRLLVTGPFAGLELRTSE